MSKLCLKKTSKRMTCKKRFKIEKKVRDHNRKLKKQQKKTGSGKRKETIISVPKSCPFKEEILQEAESKREQIREEKAQKRKEAKLRNKANKVLNNTKKKTTKSS